MLLIPAAALALLAAAPAPSFTTEVAAVFSRAGCNAGSCHGSFSGKGGFRLSLFGHEPEDDFERVTREAFGRRIDRISPRRSLLLLKATGRVPHGGGKRLEEGSPAHDVLARWLDAGAPNDFKTAPALLSVEARPAEAVLPCGASRQLRVTARFSDGSRADVTALAVYTSQDEGVASVSREGKVTALRPGDAPIVVSYLGQFGRSHAFVPVAGARNKAPDWKPANFIDTHVQKRHEKLNVAPAPLCDDTAFLRRVSLDLCGTLPTPKEIHAFRADASAGKRAAKIEELLRRPEYARWWATRFSDLTGNDNRYLGYHNWKLAYGWWDWLRVRIERDEPYNNIVRDILVATSREGRTLDQYTRWLADEKPRMEDRKRWDLRYHERKTLDTFWAKSSNRAPEVVAQEVAHAFLGLRLDCAQCHRHPFGRWTQGDFWGFAAFFPRVMMGYPADARARVKGGKRPPFKEVFVAGKGDLWLRVRHPKTQAVLPPRVLGGPATPDDPNTDPRVPLAEWITSPKNPYFARALVNRVWAHYLGRGLVEPTDAISDANPPSHPELLDALADDFVKNGFSLKRLHRTILNSRAYQSSCRGGTEAAPARAFARYPVKRLPAEVLVDAVNYATEAPFDTKDILVPPGTRAIAYPLSRASGRVSYAFRIFGRPIRAEICDCERDNSPSLPQALYLLNDAEMLYKLRAPKGRLARMLRGGQSDAELVEELFLVTLSRGPTKAEAAAALRRVAAWRKEGAARMKGETPEGAARREAFEDLLWALLSLKEFVTNH